jgi:hypothetical protein
LTNLAIRLNELRRLDAALEVTREAVALRRELATENPDVFRPDLAMSLHNLSVELSNGDREAALEPVQEALELIWPLFLRYPRSHAKLTGTILWQILALHKALGRDPPSAFVDREASFAQVSGRRTGSSA